MLDNNIQALYTVIVILLDIIMPSLLCGLLDNNIYSHRHLFLRIWDSFNRKITQRIFFLHWTQCEFHRAPERVTSWNSNVLRCPYSDDFRHLARLYRSVPVDVVHLERPFELLFGSPRRGDVDRLKELFEVDLAAVVRIERPEDVLAELVGVTLREETWVHFEEFVPRQLTIRTVPLQRVTHEQRHYE